MTTENKKQPLAEQESYALSITNKNCYPEVSKFFLLIHQSTCSLQNILMDASYPMREFRHLAHVQSEALDEYTYKELMILIDKSEQEAEKLARQCAEIRRRLTGKEAQNV
jgi:hypothetical protein